MVRSGARRQRRNFNDEHPPLHSYSDIGVSTRPVAHEGRGN